MGLKPLERHAGELSKTNGPDEQFSGTQQLAVRRSHALLCCSSSTCKMNVQKAKAWNNNVEGLDAEKVITGCLHSFILEA